jgi:hypothetical protein
MPALALRFLVIYYAYAQDAAQQSNVKNLSHNLT